MAWLTLDQADRYVHFRSGEIKRLVEAGQITAYMKPYKSVHRIVSTDDIDQYIKTQCKPYVPQKIALLRKAGVA